jgi:hypothetical protein
MFRILFIIFSLGIFVPFFGLGKNSSIFVSEKGSKEELLAAKEIRKYIYLRTNDRPLASNNHSERERLSGESDYF